MLTSETKGTTAVTTAKSAAAAPKKSSNKPPFPPVPSVIFDKKKGKTYRKGDTLGEGGFAKCFYITNQENVQLAAKVIPKSSLKSTKQRSKLYGEINIHRALSHPHVVRWYEVFEDDEFVYMVLELCENNTFVDMLKKRKRLTEPEVKYFMWQLLDGVRYLHDRKVIHRDLKLGNIFLTKDMQVKIGDFGLAACIKHDGERKRTICGTPNYIAPEVLFDTTNGHSYEVDMWSLGVIMYTLIVGRPPFQTKDVKAIYNKIKNNNYEFPSNLIITDSARLLITSLLNTKPECRPMVEDVMEHPFFHTGSIVTYMPPSALHSVPDLRGDDMNLVEKNVLGERSPGDTNVGAKSQQQHKTEPIIIETPPIIKARQVKLDAENTDDLILKTSQLKIQNRSPLPDIWKNESAPPVVQPSVNPWAAKKPIADTNIFGSVGRTRQLRSYTAAARVSENLRAEVPNAYQMQKEKKHDKENKSVLTSISTAMTNIESTTTVVKKAESQQIRAEISPFKASKNEKLEVSPSVSKFTAGSSSCGGDSSKAKSTTQALEMMHLKLKNALNDRLMPFTGTEVDETFSLPPTFFITKWVDFCDKYGLGYQLFDGTVGVYFNDSTSMILSSNDMNFEYLYHEKNSSGASTILRRGYTLADYPTQLKKKVTLLKHFKGYMKDNLEKHVFGKNNSPASSISSSPLSQPSTPIKTNNLTFLTKYLRTKFGVIFRLSNHNVQFNLFDHSKIILSHDGAKVTYINKKREMQSWALEMALRHEDLGVRKEITERLKFSKDVLGQMLVRRVKKEKEEES